MKQLTVILAIFILISTELFGQIRTDRQPKPLKYQKEAAVMEYIVENGDTIFFESLPPVYKTAKRKGKEWRKHYRLVHNFAKVYPYALIAGELMHDVDSTFGNSDMRRGQRVRYINAIQHELFETFESTLRNMTITQGQLLLRLIDRETGITPYEIIDTYKGRAAAGFWQGIARLFKSDMKRPYDPDGDDIETEKLVQAYQKGDFRQIYLSIFGKEPPEPVARPKHDYPQK